MVRTLTALLAAIALAGPAAAFNTNSVWWQPEQLPLPVELVLPGSDDLGQQGTEELVLEAFDAWSDLPCTSFEYEFLGWVDEVVPMDGVVQIEWVESDWVGDPAIAGATAIQIDPFEEVVVDVNLSFNGQYIEWTTEDSNPYANPKRLDARAVMLHELGHIFGLDHNNEMIEATMFFAYLSAAGGTLSWDDKWGMCSLYPAAGDECQVDEDCPDHPDQEYVCRHVEELGHNVCEEVYDDLGACCDAHWNNCAGAACKLSLFPPYEGYCTWWCEDDGDCPGDWACDPVTFLGEARSWCVSPLGAGQPCGDEFEWPGDDDDSAADDDGGDDDSGDDDDAAADDDDDGGCGCRTDRRRGGSVVAMVLLAALVGLRGRAARRRDQRLR